MLEVWLFFAASNLINIQNANHLTFTGGTPENMLDAEIVINGMATSTANITIENLHLNRVSTGNPLVVASGASLNLTISATNTLQNGGVGGAGLSVGGVNTLTIDGSGSLTARGHGLGAGIGGTGGTGAGNITILPTFNGTINAYGGANGGAGIGGGSGANGSNVTIGGGVINATGGGSAPAIGAGSGNNNHGILNVTGGNVTQTVMNSTQLDEALTAIGNDTGTIRLGASFTHNQLTTIPTGANITLTSDSTVRTLTRGVTGHFITVQNGANLMLENITIDGNSTGFPNAGGRLVLVHGNLTMNNGTTIQNNQGTGGGGVNVQLGATFNMTGGFIINNGTADGFGGGVNAAGTGVFTMTGGEISGNTAFADGGGVDQAGTGAFTLGGTATITNNTVGGNPNNVSLGSNSFITLGTGANVPAWTSPIGITVSSFTPNGVFVNSGATMAHAAFFTADDPALSVIHDSGQLRLGAVPSATKGNVTIGNAGGNVVITLTNDIFTNPLATPATWITNLPAGMTQIATRNSDTQVTIAIDGTPSAASTAPIAITIPAASLVTSSSNLAVTANALAVFATTAITNIPTANLTITAPALNGIPAASAGIGGVTTFTSGTVTWTPNNNPFTGGQQYTASVTLTATAGHTFPTTFAATINTSHNATVNVTNPGTAQNTVTVTFTFPSTTNAPITGAALSVTAPVTGQTRDTLATGTGNFTIGPVSWVPASGTAFTGGTIYTAGVLLTADSGHTFTGLTAGADVTVNGNPATISGNTGATVTLLFNFPATETVPGPPTAVSAAAGNGAATVSFTPPASNGGSVITGFTVTSSPGGLTATGTASPIIVPGLDNGTTYTFTVRATNANGTGPASAPSNPVTPELSAAPVITSEAPPDGTVGVAYSFTFAATGVPAPTWAQTGTLPTGLSFDDSTGILAGTPSAAGSFTFTVTATNAAGTISQPHTVVISAVTVPTPPQNLIAIPGNGQVALGWEASASDGGSPITRYEVQLNNTGPWINLGTGFNYTLTGLANGTAVTIALRAVNAQGPSTVVTQTVTPVTVPTAPENFTATAGNGQVTLAWEAPLSDGGSSIIGYQVSINNGAWQTAFGLGGTFTGLTNGVAHTFRVRAVNAQGPGVYASETATPTGGGWTPPPTPVITITTQPEDATVIRGDIDSNLYVTATVTQGATRSYRWYRATDANRTGASTFTGATTATFSKPTDLTPGTHYFYVVISATGATSVRSDVAIVTVTLDGAGGFPFVDVPVGHWAREYVEFVWERDIMQGVSDTRFAPDATLSRAMAATIIWRMAGEPAATGGTTFTDVAAGQWYSTAIAWANQNDIARGVGGNRFNPATNVTREEFAAMMYRYTVFTGGNTSVPAGFDLSQFQDRNQLSDWAESYMYWANHNGLITGRTPTTLAPQGTATRAEAAGIVARFVAVGG